MKAGIQSCTARQLIVRRPSPGGLVASLQEVDEAHGHCSVGLIVIEKAQMMHSTPRALNSEPALFKAQLKFQATTNLHDLCPPCVDAGKGS